MRTVRFENLANYFGPMNAEKALEEALRCEQESENYPVGDPGKRMFLRDSAAALEYAQLLEQEENAALHMATT